MNFNNVPPPYCDLRRTLSHRSRDEVGDNADGGDGRGDEGFCGGMVASCASTTGYGWRTDLTEIDGTSERRSAK